MPSTEEELSQLSRAAAHGDTDALADLVRATQGDVWRFVAHLAGREAADDLTQETYLRALRSLPTYRHRAPVRVWLLAVARRVVATHFDDLARDRRRRNKAAAQPIALAAGDPAEELALRSLVTNLDPERRDAFVLTQLLGLSYADAATACDCPIGTIRSRVARAREQLIGHVTDQDVPDKSTGRKRP